MAISKRRNWALALPETPLGISGPFLIDPFIVGEHGSGLMILSSFCARLANLTEAYYTSLMKTFSLKLPKPLHIWLEREAIRRQKSKSDLVREAIERQRQGQKKVTAMDLVGHLCGIGKGPGDLSTNKKYFEGYGR